jgi:hypothetical protein
VPPPAQNWAPPPQQQRQAPPSSGPGWAPPASRPQQQQAPNSSWTPPQSTRVNPTTTAAIHDNHAGFTLNHQTSDGGQLVVHSTVLPNGQRHLEGYRQFTDPGNGARTRIYLDGRRSIVGRDFVTQTIPGRGSLTIHQDGLREARFADGHRIFAERWEMRRWHDHDERVIVRTVYAPPYPSMVLMGDGPFEQIYGGVFFNGVYLYAYQPYYWQPAYFPAFFMPFPTPLYVSASCYVCPGPLVMFEQPPVVYQTPVELLGDLQISTAIADGYAPPAPPDDAEVQALAQQVAELQAQVQADQAANADLAQQLQQSQAALMAARYAASAPPPVAAVGVPEPVRQQIHRQVGEDIALHQSQQPLTVPEIITSAQAWYYIFQISQTIDATDLNTGEECALTTGDLAQFNQIPAPGEMVAQMRIITSKPGSCRAGSVVDVGLSDLQDMLNVFAQRLEANMKKVHDQAMPGSP